MVAVPLLLFETSCQTVHLYSPPPLSRPLLSCGRTFSALYYFASPGPVLCCMIFALALLKPVCIFLPPPPAYPSLFMSTLF